MRRRLGTFRFAVWLVIGWVFFTFSARRYTRCSFQHLQFKKNAPVIQSTSNSKLCQFVLFTFLLDAGADFEGDGSSTGLVFRLFENFLRFRLSAANAPNPTKKIIFFVSNRSNWWFVKVSCENSSQSEIYLQLISTIVQSIFYVSKVQNLILFIFFIK